MQRLLRSVEATDASERIVSLHRKILTGYVLLGAALVFAMAVLQRFELGLRWQVPIGFFLTVVAALTLPRLLARVNRVRVLSRSAFEISQGDLSKPVEADP